MNLIIVCVFLIILPKVPTKKIIDIGVLLKKRGTQIELPLVASIHKNNLIHHDIVYQIQDQIITGDPFEASKSLCDIIIYGNGLAAVINTIDGITASALESTCANLELPFLQVGYSLTPSLPISNVSSIDLFPEVELFAEGLATIIKSLQWKSYVVLYEDESKLNKLKYVLKNEPNVEDKKGNFIKVMHLGKGPDYRAAFKDIQYIPETNILLDCNVENIYEILRQAQNVRMAEIFHSYILTSLDAHTVDLTPLNLLANITSIRIFDPESDEMKMAIRNWENVEHNLNGKNIKINPYHIKTETVLMHDAIEHLIETINNLHVTKEIETLPLKCYESTIWEEGIRIASFAKIKPLPQSLSGPIKFSENGSRIDFKIELIKGNRNVTLGSWRSENPLRWVSNRTETDYEKDVKEMLKGQTLIVATRIMVPYLDYKSDAHKRMGNDQYEGYALDLIHAISKLVGFTYIIKVVEDNEIGHYDMEKRQWNGLIKEIIEHRAHLAIGDLAMTYTKQQYVDFSSPFMNLGIGILIKKPEIKSIPLFSFLDPFTKDVWIYTITLFFALTLVIFFVYRFSPNEWANPHPCDREPEELEIEWKFSNCFWLTLGSLMQQGSDILPRTLSTRITLSCWWFFSLIMYNSYTANLAAFLTTEKSGIIIRNVEDLAKQNKIKYGCIESGDTYDFFRLTDYSTYQKMWNNMVANNPSVFVKSDAEGIKRVLTTKDGLYAYLTESTVIDYEIKTRCRLKSVGTWLNSISYAIAMPINAGYLGIINSAILNLSESGELDKFKEKWWEHNRKEPICKEEREREKDSSLSVENVLGVFLVVGTGVCAAYLVAICEFLWNVKNIALEKKISYYEVLKSELRFAINIKSSKKRLKPKIVQEKEDSPTSLNEEVSNINQNGIINLITNFDKNE